LRKPADAPIYQLKVTLKHIRPPIWRRVLVRGDISLGKLHRILQIVMGWGDMHLHQFVIGGVAYGQPDPNLGLYFQSERRANLNEVAPVAKHQFIYEYDFGDSWDHQILVEKILPPDPGAHYPVCVAGKRASPPEDCGGVPGYYSLSEAMSDPEHPEHANLREWLGYQFDAEAIDLAEINDILADMR
jgi:hypothetical protein